MTVSIEIAASSLGVLAYEARQASNPARVVGVTSRGIFLLVPPRQIVFVSVERYRSPLTINLERALERLRALEIGALAQFSGARLIFPSIELFISLSADVVWHCPPPGSTPRPQTEQRRTLQAIAEGVLMQGRDAGMAAILPRLLAWSDATPLSVECAVILERLLAVRRAAQAGDSHSLLVSLTGLLGQGRGLTPSGDDVVIGWLLMLNRWQVDRDWATVIHTISEAAYRVTTTISANLIECAAAGQGDERLITVVDGIAAGAASIDKCLECVLSWGNSSGVDALVGMAMAVTAL